MKVHTHIICPLKAQPPIVPRHSHSSFFFFFSFLNAHYEVFTIWKPPPFVFLHFFFAFVWRFLRLV